MGAYLSVLLFGLAATAGTPPGPQTRLAHNGCGSPDLQERAEPSFGPARLIRFDCLQLPNTPFTSSPPVLSPDGKSFLVYQYARGLLVGSLQTGSVEHVHPGDPLAVHFVWIDDIPSKLLFHWNADSRSILAGEQQTAGGGFAIGPLKPLVVANGARQTLPALVARAGPLDGLMWIGGEGLALAQFGTRGGYYKPEHSDPEPMLALVDVKRGKFLGWFLLRDFPKAVTAQGQPMVPMSIASVLLPDGRPKIVFQWPNGFSMAWTQGERPREIKLPRLPWLAQITLTPDGGRLLISYPLSGGVGSCEEADYCPPPRLVTGKYAELVDIDAGTTIWANTGTATQFGTRMEPAVSLDGRFALIGIPQHENHLVGLISMSDGRVLQTMPGQWSEWSAAFRPDSAGFYISGGRYVASYEISRR